MKTYNIILVVTLLLIASKTVVAQQQTAGMKSSEKIDNLINEYAENRGFMGSVLVAEKGNVIFSKGYGLADVENNIANVPDTKFRIGSITKQFTAMLITQLAEQGKLRLDKTISDYLPNFPSELGKSITIEMLLNHTSGLRFPEGIEKYYYAKTNDEYLHEFFNQQMREGFRFQPGKGYGYSNAGYHILGLLIEKVTDKSYEQVLYDQILKPLGMKNTGCDREGLILENEAVSYQKLKDGRYLTWSKEHSYIPEVIHFASGHIYSTCDDLLKFSMAITSGKLLSKKYTDIFLEMRNVKTRLPIPQISSSLVKEFFGKFGNGYVGEISILENPVSKTEQYIYWHDGTLKLFKSNHFHFTDKDQVIIILSNCSFLGEGNEMVLKIYQLINHKPYDHIRIKNSLWQYVSEDIGTHAGEEVALSEWHRFKNDTLNFLVEADRVNKWKLNKALEEHGVSAMVKLFEEIKKSTPNELNESVLNELGYTMLGNNRVQDAITIFKLNVEFYPDYANGYDSLGEAYMINGDKPLAIENYKKSLELNPSNQNAREVLNKLKKK